MFDFRFQSKLIQTEGILAQLAHAQFDTAMEQFYYNAGKSLQTKNLRGILNFASFLSMPDANNVLMQYARGGIANLMYGKTAINSPCPALWVLKGKDLKDAIKTLKPFLNSIPLSTHSELIKDIARRGEFTVPAELIDALKGTAKTQCNTKSLLCMAIMYVLDYGLVVYNRPKISRSDGSITGYDTCFLTRNANIIMQLSQSGALYRDSDPQACREGNTRAWNKFASSIFGAPGTPWGSMTASALSENKIAVAKLVPNKTSADFLSFDMAVVKVDLASPDAMFLPVSLMRSYCEGLIESLISCEYASITCKGIAGEEDYTANITAVPELYKRIYDDCEDKQRVSERAYLPVGFSLRTGRIMLLNVESSLYSSQGYSRINPYFIKDIRKLAVSQINTSAHDVTPSAIYTVFERSLQNATPIELAGIVGAIPELDKVLAGAPATVDAIVMALPRVHYSAILRYLQSKNPNILSEIRKVGTRVETTDTILTGNTVEEKIDNLNALLKNNFVRIVYLGKEGITEIISTSNEKLLASKLGSDYKLKYEAWGVKCAALRDIVAASGVSISSLAGLIQHYNIKYLDVSKLKSLSLEDFDTWVAEADASRPKRKSTPNPELISVRALNKPVYWQSLKFSNIQSVSIVTNI